jgi:hypothetical protein
MKNTTKGGVMATKHAGGHTRSDPGQKPELKWLAVDKLYVDSRYQRNTKSKASEKNLEYTWRERPDLCLYPRPHR